MKNDVDVERLWGQGRQLFGHWSHTIKPHYLIPRQSYSQHTTSNLPYAFSANVNDLHEMKYHRIFCASFHSLTFLLAQRYILHTNAYRCRARVSFRQHGCSLKSVPLPMHWQNTSEKQQTQTHTYVRLSSCLSLVTNQP